MSFRRGTRRKLIKSTGLLLLLVILTNAAFAQHQHKERTYDVIVYGGTSAGVIAAYTAKQMCKSVLLIEPGI